MMESSAVVSGPRARYSRTRARMAPDMRGVPFHMQGAGALPPPDNTRKAHAPADRRARDGSAAAGERPQATFSSLAKLISRRLTPCPSKATVTS